MTNESSNKKSDAFRRACALRDSGNIEEAVQAFRSALAEEPLKAGGWAALGRLLLDRGDVPDGIECLKRATVLKPKSDIFAGSLYFALLDARRYQEAKAEAQRFLDLVREDGVPCADDIRGDLEAILIDYEHVVREWAKRVN